MRPRCWPSCSRTRDAATETGNSWTSRCRGGRPRGGTGAAHGRGELFGERQNLLLAEGYRAGVETVGKFGYDRLRHPDLSAEVEAGRPRSRLRLEDGLHGVCQFQACPQGVGARARTQLRAAARVGQALLGAFDARARHFQQIGLAQGREVQILRLQDNRETLVLHIGLGCGNVRPRPIHVGEALAAVEEAVGERKTRVVALARTYHRALRGRVKTLAAVGRRPRAQAEAGKGAAPGGPVGDTRVVEPGPGLGHQRVHPQRSCDRLVQREHLLGR